MTSEAPKPIGTADTVVLGASGVRRKKRKPYRHRLEPQAGPTVEDLISRATFMLRDQIRAESGEWSVSRGSDATWKGEAVFRFAEDSPQVIVCATRTMEDEECSTMNSAQLALLGCLLCFEV